MLPIYLDIDSKVPHYSSCKKRRSKREIQEFLALYGYDEEYIKNIDDSFCQGFGTAIDVVIEMLKYEYCKN